MSFPKYTVYKDSGIEWLGYIPSHWTITKLKYVSKFQTGWTPPTGKSELFEGDNLWANISDLGPRILTDTAKRISDEAIRASNINISPEGSLLFSFKLSIGQVGFAGQDMYTNEAIATFMDGTDASLSFLYYSLPIFAVENASTNIYGAKLLNQELIKSSRLCLPPLSEQSAIATFLDRETAKIDALVAEQEKLIELLKEKRQAVISHAVTKGLDPNVPMKDSGVEWLGEVPEHWDVRPLGSVSTSIQTGPFGSQLHADEYVDDQIPVINPANIQNESIVPASDLTVAQTTALRLNIHQLEIGDIIFGRRGEMGRCAVVTKNEVGWICGTGSLKVRPDCSCVVSFYLAVFLRTPFIREKLGLESVGSTMDNLNTEILAKLKVLIPPLNEQEVIFQFVEKWQNKLDDLIEESQNVIRILKERRSALISAAVTGKIDVRGLAEATQ